MLPSDQQLDIKALSKLFTNTTNSYKLLFFMAILNHVKTSESQASTKICVSELTEHMLYLAAYPIRYFNLNFGLQDQMESHLSSLSIDELKVLTPKIAPALNEKIHRAFANSSAKELENYVPFRLLQPFFSSELKGLNDVEKKNDKTFELAKQYFDERKPLYKLEKCKQELFLILHPLWLKYLHQNYSIVRAWAEFAWVSYLQRKKPKLTKHYM